MSIMETDYSDIYTAIVRNAYRMAAGDLFWLMFVHDSNPVLYLLQLCDRLVKPFGLQDGGSFTDLIREQGDKHVAFGKSDKHLDFNVLQQCDVPDAQRYCQTIWITTVVKFCNQLGRVYFFHPSFPCLDL